MTEILEDLVNVGKVALGCTLIGGAYYLMFNDSNGADTIQTFARSPDNVAAIGAGVKILAAKVNLVGGFSLIINAVDKGY